MLPPRFCLVALALVGAPAPARAADAPELPKTFDLKALDAYVAAQVKAKGFTGLSVAFMRDGKVVFAKGYGKASIRADEPVGPQTLFAAGSITKQFTCACVLLLAEEGKLSVQDKVAKYYPDLTRAKDISLYDLMTHVSGYPDYYPLDFIDRRMEKTIALDRLVKDYAGGKLDFEPGSRWSYSNTGYIILGRVVEKVSGKPFGQFLDERILRPLGMADSAFEPKPGHKGVATGHTAFALGDPEVASAEADGWVHAAGGLYTTPSDLLKWDLALIDGKVLKPESYRLMTEPRKLSDGRVKDYGCGLAILRRDGETLYRHGGAVSGFLAFNAVLPRTRSGLALMVNADDLDAGSLNAELLGLLVKTGVGEPDVPKVAGPAPKEAALALLRQLQKGEVERAGLGEEYSVYLTAARMAAAKARLGPLGEPEKADVEDTHERGGMEVAVLRLTFKGGQKAKAYLYRTPDGKVQELLLYKN